MDRRKGILLFMAAAIALLLIFGKNEKPGGEKDPTVVAGPEWHGRIPVVSEEAVQAEPEPTQNPEEAVYSFLQGPKSWKEGREWSGKWGKNTTTAVRLAHLDAGFAVWLICILH